MAGAVVCMVLAAAALVCLRRPKLPAIRRGPTERPPLEALVRLDPVRPVRRGLGRWWLTGLGFLLALLLWSTSYPGSLGPAVVFSLTGILLLGALWLYRFVRWLRSRQRTGVARWAIAPAMVVVTVGLIVTHVPLRVRFELGRDEFDRITEGLEPRGSFDEWEPLDVPDEVGTYEIDFAFQVGANVILYESHGWYFNDAGFAYLPDGVDPRLASDSFEAPRYISLGGGWYAWRASW
jgi:hypothetical protein